MKRSPFDEPRLLFHLIAAKGENQLQAPAIESPGKTVLTYKNLTRHLQATALQLTRMGIRLEDRLAVVLPNGPEMATAFLAISSVCTCAPLNPAYREEEYRISMEELHVKALVALAGSDTPARKAATRLGIPVIDLEPDAKIAGTFTLAGELPVDKSIFEPRLAGLDDTALVLQTSGTTSRPKTVPITHRNIFHSVNNISTAYTLSAVDRCLNMMPLFHIHGMMAALAASLASGGSVVCAPGFLPDRVLDWLTGYKPTWYTAVPTMQQSILEEVRQQPEIVRKMKLRFIRSCSSSLAPQVAQDLEAVFGVPVLEAYGMTEGTHQIASNPLPPLPHKFGSVGLATGTTLISILDEQGNTLPTGVVGEICIRGGNVMGGYENNPAANAASYTNGWLRTGDRGYLDEEGYLFIQGRLKELINRGGEKITPREIDEVLLRHPAVEQAVAFAVPHASLGEDVGAAIVLREGRTVSAQELRQFTAANLADFKVPRQIVFVREIPKGPTGKVQRIGLAEKLKQVLEISNVQITGDKSKPRTDLESEILAIWQQVLNKQVIGTSDDFLSLGGESIQAARILTRLNERFGTNLQISDIFTVSTVASMADLVQAGRDQDNEYK